VSQTLQKIQELVKRGDIRVSEHGYDELAADELFIREIIDGAGDAVQIEDCPDYFRGPCVLVLQTDAAGLPIHVVWGIPRNAHAPAVPVTAYRPSQDKWSADFKLRL
jgi:hypothetical protein